MRRLFWLVLLLAITMPVAAFADSSLITQNHKGALKAPSSGPKGVLFRSSFSNPMTAASVARTRTIGSGWQVNGLITGTYEGLTVDAKSVGWKVGRGMIIGSMVLGSVPEPGTLGLLGTGLLGIAGLVRHKSRSK